VKTIILTLLSAAVWSLAMASGASAQLNDAGRALVASNTLRLSADTLRTGGTTLVKEFIVPYAGVVRVKWEMRSGAAGKTATAIIASAIDACTSTNSTTTFQMEQCDLRVVAGDSVKAHAQGEFVSMPVPGFSPTAMRNVRVYYNVVNATGTGKVVSN